MADFKTHIGTSSTIGIVYGVAGHVHWHLPLSTCIVGGCLCGVAGVLPDIDSDSGRTQREILTWGAAVVPMLMMDRFARLGMNHEQMVLAGGCVYVIVRLGFGEFLRRHTVHRGMFHSIPAAAIAGLIASLVCSCEILSMRLFKVMSVVLGYLIHLALDELWAIEMVRGNLRFKNSFGTAMKLFSMKWFPNVFTYGLLLSVGTLAYHDPAIMEHFSPPNPPAHAHVTPDDATHSGGLKPTGLRPNNPANGNANTYVPLPAPAPQPTYPNQGTDVLEQPYEDPVGRQPLPDWLKPPPE